MNRKVATVFTKTFKRDLRNYKKITSTSALGKLVATILKNRTSRYKVGRINTAFTEVKRHKSAGIL